MKIVLLAIVLSFVGFFGNAAACGRDNQNESVVVEKNQPISFEVFVQDGRYGRIKITSDKRFIIGEGYGESVKNKSGWYTINILPGGETVQLVYQLYGSNVQVLTGKYEYMAYALYKCFNSPTVMEWVLRWD